MADAIVMLLGLCSLSECVRACVVVIARLWTLLHYELVVVWWCVTRWWLSTMARQSIA